MFKRLTWWGTPLGLHKCTPQDKLDAVTKFNNVKLDCDEYPFSASKEGGYWRYQQGRVSARFIPVIENRSFGSMLNSLQFMNDNDPFIVAPFSEISGSFIINQPSK